MRQIKFRGQRLDNGEWVYGSLIKNIIDEDLTATFIVPSLPCVYEGRDMFTAKMFRTCNSTVSQFTGLYDKNDKEIYEGDLVFNHLHRLEYICKWEEKSVCFYFMLKNRQKELYHFQKRDEKFLEVIGNIHDNPELLNTRE